MDKHGITIFYTTYISVDLAYHEIFRAKVGKGGIKLVIFALILRFCIKHIPGLQLNKNFGRKIVNIFLILSLNISFLGVLKRTVSLRRFF